MQKFSKKLVSKVIYVKILLASHPDLLEHFLKEKGWELLNAWFDDAIKTLNWPLCAEMTQLFTKCPMTAQRLKENVEINLAPKLIRQLSCDQRVDATVRQNASLVLSKWMAVVATVNSNEHAALLNTQPVVLLQSNLPHQLPSQGSGRTTRGSRSALVIPPTDHNVTRVPVIVHTDYEEILNLDRMPPSTLATKEASETEGQVWVGKGGSKRAERNARRRGALGQPSRKTPPPGKSKEIVETDEEEDSDEDYKPPEDDPFDTLLSSSITNEKQKVDKTMKLIGVIRNETLDEVEPEPVKLLQGLAMELSETLKKEAVEVKKEENDSKKAKEKEARREKERQERREREKRDERRKGDEKGDRKDKDKHRHSSDKEKDKQREERRRKEKERERQKEKERKEKKRESKPYRETEMRDKLDSTEKLKIKELAQKLREDSKTKMGEPTPSSASLPKIPKMAKSEEAKKEVGKPGSGGGAGKKPSFEDLMFSLNSSSAQAPIKPAPIKNKSRDLIASLSEDSPVSKAAAKQREEERKKTENKNKTSSLSKNGPSSPASKVEEQAGKPSSDATMPEKKPVEKKEERIDKEEQKVDKEEEKKGAKRASTDNAEPPKLKIKSQAQLKEGTMFGDFLSTIMPEQPKKKKIKLADLKAQKEAKAASENIVKPEKEEKDDSLEKSLANAASSFSFYRDTMSEANGEKSPETDGSKKEGSTSPQEDPPVAASSDSELPFEEPENTLPREVRGILVLTKGPKRTRRIKWRPQESLVEVEYFELDETERVNVNKLKFEEARKNEAIAEKAKMLQKQNAVVEDNRPWLGMKPIECELPEIDYGGNSNEKKEQEQRENKVLQILFFNNKLPNDPSEPDAAGGARIVTKPIPLEDTSGDEAYTDYSGEPWPAPIQEKENTPVFDNLLNNMQSQPELLKNIMGSALPETGNPDMDSAAAAAALYAAQKAAEETLRKHGVEVPRRQDEIVPMEQELPLMNPNIPPPMMPPPFKEDFPSEYPPEFPGDGPPRDFYQQPPPPWQNGAPPFRGGPPHHRGGPYNRNGGPPPNEDFNRGGFRGGPRGGGGGPMRDFHHNNHHNNGFHGGHGHHDRHHEDRGGWDRRDDRRRDVGRKEYSRPCKFWMEKGYCREENRCKFPHPQGR